MEKTLPVENQRIKIFREHLKLSQKEFADHLEMKQGSISDIERGKNSPMKIAKLLELQFSLNIDWLKTGKGSMVLDNSFAEPKAEYQKGKGLISWVPAKSYGMLINLHKVGREIDNQFETSNLPFVTETSLAIEIDDQDMVPEVNKGDYFVGTRLPGLDWLVRGKLYYFVTDAGLLLRLFEGRSNGQLNLNTFSNKPEQRPESSVLAVYHKDWIISR